MIIFSNKCGQLGNRLFCFAHLIANAVAFNHTVVNLSFDEYALFFHNTSQDVFCRFPVRKSGLRFAKLRSLLFFINKSILKALRVTGITSGPFYEVVVADLPQFQFKDTRSFDLKEVSFQRALRSKPFVFLFGRFFRDYSNLEKYQDLIRTFFRPVDEIEQHVHDLVRSARKMGDVLIGVHIRRGDYQQFSEGRYFYSQQQYADKMRELAGAFPGSKVAFILCSNERIDPHNFEALEVISGSGHLVEDMYALAGCDLIMGPPSTFTLWASFYGKVPLYQMKDLRDPMKPDAFKILPPEILYNFSFN